MRVENGMIWMSVSSSLTCSYCRHASHYRPRRWAHRCMRSNVLTRGPHRSRVMSRRSACATTGPHDSRCMCCTSGWMCHSTWTTRTAPVYEEYENDNDEHCDVRFCSLRRPPRWLWLRREQLRECSCHCWCTTSAIGRTRRRARRLGAPSRPAVAQRKTTATRNWRSRRRTLVGEFSRRDQFVSNVVVVRWSSLLFVVSSTLIYVAYTSILFVFVSATQLSSFLKCFGFAIIESLVYLMHNGIILGMRLFVYY